MKQLITNSFALIGIITVIMAFTSSKASLNSKCETSQIDSLNLGISSISLAVENIQTSYNFYKKLGFQIKDGAVEQNWVILMHGNIKIGLFQDMFPSNTITFNPTNGRAIHKNLIKQGISPNFEAGLDSTNGPCTFSITDPDGNPILIDQH